MKRGALVFATILFLVAISLLTATFRYPLRSKIFPLIVLFTILILLTIQIYREAPGFRKKERREPRPHSIAIWLWLGLTLIMLWFFGFIGTVILLPFLYLRFHSEGWIISIALPLGCGVFFYTLFGLALRMPLYPGVLFPQLFD